MNNYIDQYGRYHDKPVTGADPIPSNNGWIYTAYAKALGFEVDLKGLKSCYSASLLTAYPFMINRSPDKKLPPMSRDEIIGMVSVGMLVKKLLDRSDYNFCNLRRDLEIRHPSLSQKVQAAISLWKIRKEHRNYAWLNTLKDTYCLLFKLSPSDIYYVKSMSVLFHTSLAQKTMFNLNILTTLASNNTSSKLILWLQLTDLGHPLAKLLPHKKWFGQYFPKEHPFNLKLAEN